MISWRIIIPVCMLSAFIIGCSQTYQQFEPHQASAEATSAKARAADASGLSESELVDQLQQIRADYRRILELLHRWYLETGWHDKATWAANETKDLERVVTYQYLGQVRDERPMRVREVDEAHKGTMQAVDMSDFSEVDRIEQINKIRSNYHLALQSLVQYYSERGQRQKSRWAQRELDDYQMIRRYPYLMEVDIYQTDLTPRDSIVEADRLFQEAHHLYREGRILPLVNDKRKLKEALDKFVLLIQLYPTSDKIDDAAFYAGEISKEYFNDNVQAVRYYELALKWNPQTPHPVRFQAAVVYDFRMYNRARAMELYQLVLQEETEISRSNLRFATRRLMQLLQEKEDGLSRDEGIPVSDFQY